MLSPSDLSAMDTAALRSRTDHLMKRARKKVVNWAESYGCQPAAIFRPRSVEQVQLIVERVRREGKELRCFGSIHSPSDLALTDGGYMLSLDDMQQVLSYDLSSGKMTVQAGIRLTKLITEAAVHNLAMPNLGSIAEQSLAGAMSTATHGCGLSYGCISHYVTALTIVVADGSVKKCSSAENVDLFHASRCALGTTGVIVEATINLDPAFKLEEEVFSMEFGDFVDAINPNDAPDRPEYDGSDGILACSQHLRCWWFPQTDHVRVSGMNRSHKAITPPGPLYQRVLTDELIGKHLHQSVLYIARTFPTLLKIHARFMWALVFSPDPLSISVPQSIGSLIPSWFPWSRSGPAIPDRSVSASGSDAGDLPLRLKWWTPSNSSRSLWRVDDSNKLFTYDCGPRQYTFEGCVPIHRTQETLRALDDWLKGEAADRDGIRHHFPIEIRPVEADEVWLAPTYHTRVVYIGVMMYKPFGARVDYEDFFGRFERILKQFDGRPHWAKAHHYTQDNLRKIYPRFDDFLKVRQEVDPSGMFLNPYTRRVLLGQSKPAESMKQFLL